MDVLLIELDASAERAEAFEVDFDGSCADFVAAGEWDGGLSGARDEGSDDPEGGAHFGDEVLWCAGCGDILCGDLDLLIVVVVKAFRAERGEQLREDAGIGEFGDVIEGEGLVSEEAGDHHRQGGVFGA